MEKPFMEASELIEEIATNNFQWPNDIINPKKVARIFESNALSIMFAQVAVFSKNLNII
ncbi:hypothetical protein MA16_Dca012498 [Dendrobium catenatum]|uniref:Uncharacterized protein n=1 Tax=Dendrobium catenatum TaxID=906689 RepID=A0A2I0XD56_9ASPA|nr:hypothetical protein MA16_Dca012498 [Dendrobium catenatum]